MCKHLYYIIETHGTIGKCRECGDTKDFREANRKAFPLDYERASKRPIPESLVTTNGFYCQGSVANWTDRHNDIRRELLA